MRAAAGEADVGIGLWIGVSAERALGVDCGAGCSVSIVVVDVGIVVACLVVVKHEIRSVRSDCRILTENQRGRGLTRR